MKRYPKVFQQKLQRNLTRGFSAEEGGILPSGALPAVKAASEAGQRAVLDALDDDGKKVVKPKRQQKPKASEEAEKVTQKTLLESGPQKSVNK